MKIYRLVTCLSIFCAIIGTTYGQKNFAKEADKSFKNESYFSAIELYKKANASSKTKAGEKARINFNIGECYRFMVDPAQAQKYYSKAILLRYEKDNPEVLLHMAEVMKEQGTYKEAQDYFEQYLAQKPGNKEAQSGLASCTKALTWMSDPTRHIVQNEIQINTDFYDFSSAWGDRKKTSIIFSSSRPGSTGDDTDPRTGESFMDLWVTTRDNKGKWDEPKPLPETINTIDNEGASVLNAKGDRLYFTRCPRVKKENLGCDIFYSEPQGKAWKLPVKIDLKPEGDDTSSCGHPALDKSEKFMIFASDLPGGKGGKDLWMTEYNKREKSWGTPVNLGSTINTSGDEMFPYLSEDGSLYFSSTGHVGMGGLDIFKATNAGDKKWGEVENLKYPMNSAEHDYGIIFEKGSASKGFFTSSRAEGKGKDDIYNFELPDLKFALEVHVIDKVTNKPISGVTITLTGNDGSQIVKTTDEEGKYIFEENGGTRYILKETSYTMEASKVDFLAAKSKFSTVGEETSKRYVEEIFIQPTKIEDEVVALDFREVQYAYDKADLLVDDRINSKDSLDDLYRTLTENPTIIIELQAHTDCRGSATYNQKLSQRRAQSCVDYLISKGIPAERMVAVGYGEDRPRAVGLECDTIKKMKSKAEQEAAHQRNRRTQFIVLSFDYKPSENP